MKVLVVTVAGMSTRFSQSMGKECLKCLYYKDSIRESLLYRMLAHSAVFDKYIIVGGYKFEELKEKLETEFRELDLMKKISLVYNEKFSDFGSGYSLFLGIKEALRFEPSEIMFAEGDLYVDEQSYMSIYHAKSSIITCNTEPILSDKAVVFYFDQYDKIHYIYDTEHNMLQINEPFRSIYNSGQIWKFSNINLLKKIVGSLTEDQWKGTNLVLIQSYFSELDRESYRIIMFKRWVNCNMISDFERIQERIE